MILLSSLIHKLPDISHFLSIHSHLLSPGFLAVQGHQWITTRDTSLRYAYFFLISFLNLIYAAIGFRWIALGWCAGITEAIDFLSLTGFVMWKRSRMSYQGCEELPSCKRTSTNNCFEDMIWKWSSISHTAIDQLLAIKIRVTEF